MGWNSDSSMVSVGRGRVLARRLSDAGVMGSYFGVGNVSALEFSQMGQDKVEVTDYQTRSSVPLTTFMRKVVPEFTMTLLEPQMANLALMFLAEEAGEYTQAATPVSGESLGTVKVGGIYKTEKMKPTSLVVESGATAFVANTHYLLRDADLGLIEIIALPGGVVAGDPLTADYTPTAMVAGSGWAKVEAATRTKVEGGLMFIGTSDLGPKDLVVIHKCSFEPDGGYPLITDEQQQFRMKITVLSDGVHAQPWDHYRMS